MATRTRFVLLMHPKESRKVKANTGRLTHLCLECSEIHVGTSFEDHPAVNAILRDPACCPMLLYPGPEALNLSTGALRPADLGGRRLVIMLLDASWSGARKMLRLSPALQRLPRIMFTPSSPSRYLIKQQPQEGCLSTLEAVHETLLALDAGGLDTYAAPKQLLDIFARMQAIQIRCASDSERAHHHRPDGAPRGLRIVQSIKEPSRRRRYLRAAGAADPGASSPPVEVEG